MNHASVSIDVRHLQPGAFRDAEPGGIQDEGDRAVLGMVKRFEESLFAGSCFSGLSFVVRSCFVESSFGLNPVRECGKNCWSSGC